MLIISGVKVNHNSHFDQSKPHYKHFYLHFCAQDIPRIRKKPPSSMTVKEGSNVSLPCYSKGFPNPEVTWYKNGQKLNSGKYNRDTGMLTFTSIQFSDRGLYRCEARNFIGVESATVKIVVEGTGNLICSCNLRICRLFTPASLSSSKDSSLYYYPYYY